MFKKGDKVIALVDIDDKISKGTIGICNKDQYDTVYVEVKWDNFDQGWGAGKAHWNVEDKHIKLYQESIKTLNKDTVKVGQKVKVIADDARELGFEHTFNNERHLKDYIGIITSIDSVTTYHSDHKWVHLDGAPSAICTMLLELLEEPKSESLKPEDMISGEWYYAEYYGNQKWAFQYQRTESKTTFETYKHIDLVSGRKSTGGIFGFDYDIGSLRKATKEEVEKYYPNEFKFKDVIPEYVECIKGYHTDLSINDFNVVGKIYEVESYNSKSKALKLKGFRNTVAAIKFDGDSEHLSTDYKISTKEAFNLQNQPKVEKNPEILVKFETNSIVVVTKRYSDNDAKVGMIGKLIEQDASNVPYRIKNTEVNSWCKQVRQATPEECKAFESGITNIMELTEDPLIAEAKKRYPIGTKYYVAHLNKSEKDYEDTVDSHNFILDSSGVQLKGSTKDGWTRLLYENSTERWATIAKQPKQFSEEFKVGDWVTILGGTCNWCSDMNRHVGKTVQITEYKTTYLDYNNVIRFKNDGGWTWETTNNHYRKATPSEIHEAQKLERDEFISQAVEKLEVPYPKTSYKNFKECYTKLPIVTSVKRSNIVPLKLEKQKSLINLPTI